MVLIATKKLNVCVRWLPVENEYVTKNGIRSSAVSSLFDTEGTNLTTISNTLNQGGKVLRIVARLVADSGFYNEPFPQVLYSSNFRVYFPFSLFFSIMKNYFRRFLLLAVTAQWVSTTTASTASAGKAALEVLKTMDYRYFVAGGTCAAISHGITTPIDVVKTRIQANPKVREENW